MTEGLLNFTVDRNGAGKRPKDLPHDLPLLARAHFLKFLEHLEIPLVPRDQASISEPWGGGGAGGRRGAFCVQTLTSCDRALLESAPPPPPLTLSSVLSPMGRRA